MTLLVDNEFEYASYSASEMKIKLSQHSNNLVTSTDAVFSRFF